MQGLPNHSKKCSTIRRHEYKSLPITIHFSRYTFRGYPRFQKTTRLRNRIGVSHLHGRGFMVLARISLSTVRWSTSEKGLSREEAVGVSEGEGLPLRPEPFESPLHTLWWPPKPLNQSPNTEHEKTHPRRNLKTYTLSCHVHHQHNPYLSSIVNFKSSRFFTIGLNKVVDGGADGR